MRLRYPIIYAVCKKSDYEDDILYMAESFSRFALPFGISGRDPSRTTHFNKARELADKHNVSVVANWIVEDRSFTDYGSKIVYGEKIFPDKNNGNPSIEQLTTK